MSELSPPELNRKETLTRDWLLPLLPSEADQYEELNEEEIEVARSLLAQQYVEHGKLDLIWKTLLIIFVYDVLFILQSQIYGLVLSAIGSIYLSVPALHTPASLAGETIGKKETLEEKISVNAERSVKTNIGVFALFCGFISQVFSVSGPLPQELMRNNLLEGQIPNWAGFLVIFGIAFLIFDWHSD